MNKEKIQELAQAIASEHKTEEALFGKDRAITPFIRRTLQQDLRMISEFEVESTSRCTI